MRKFIIFLVVCLYANDISKSFSSLVHDYKDTQTKQTLKQIFSRNFELYPYKENYILPITYDFHHKPERKSVETKFQISFFKPFANNLLNHHEIYFLAYTQVSFWQTTQKSAPFRENNYEPELFVLFPLKNTLDALIFGLNHQSNGQGGSLSRSWNRIYVRAIFHKFGAIFNCRAWYRIPEHQKTSIDDTSGDDNPDILDYMGYGDVEIIYPYKDILYKALIRYNPATNKGALELTYSKPISKNLFLYGQYFSGYGESLIDYDKSVDKIGIGIEYSR